MLMQTHEARLDALRKQLEKQGIDGFVIPISDEHLSEYVGSYAQRLAWLTGFGGSAGTAAVLKHKAAMFVDGRYTLQVRDEVDGRLYEYKSVPQDSLAEWLAANAGKGAKIISPITRVGDKWMASCEHPDVRMSECRIEKLGLTTVVTGPTRQAVERKVGELVELGARLQGEIEQDGDAWTAVCDSPGAGG